MTRHYRPPALQDQEGFTYFQNVWKFSRLTHDAGGFDPVPYEHVGGFNAMPEKQHTVSMGLCLC